MKLTTQKLINELLKNCVLLNRSDFHIWFDFSGHVQKIDVSWINGGWRDAERTSGRVYFYLNDEDVNQKIKDATEELKKASEHNNELIKAQEEKKREKELEHLSKLKAKYEGQ